MFALASAYLGFETLRMEKIARNRMFVVFILTFFSMLFWSFFEQAGSSLNNFTDRNVDRVTEASTLGESDVGTTLRFRNVTDTEDEELAELPLLSQEQLGHTQRQQYRGRADRSGRPQRGRRRRESWSRRKSTVWSQAVNESDVLDTDGSDLLRGTRLRPAMQETARPLDHPVGRDRRQRRDGCWRLRGSRFRSAGGQSDLHLDLRPDSHGPVGVSWHSLDFEPSTPVKFAFGLIQLGLGFGAFWYRAPNRRTTAAWS